MNEYAYLEDPENNLAVKKGKLIEEKLDQLIHTNLKRHDIQTDNVTLKSYVDLADAYAAIVSRHLLRTSPTKKNLTQ